MDQYFDVFGRLHPLLLHLPIGLVVGVMALEAVAWWRGGRGASAAPAALLWLTAAAAVAAVLTGLKLSYEDGYGGRTLDIHLWLGLAFGAAAIVAAVARSRVRPEGPVGATRIYRGALVVAFGLMLAAGHFGAAMTHGENFLFEPLGRSDSATADSGNNAPDALPVSFERLGPASAEGFSAVEPIFAQKCASCHSDAVSKAGLSLASFDSTFRGSEAGSIVEIEDPAAGELLRRIKLPPDDPDHMPPENKRQLAPAELATIEAWILGTTVTGDGDSADAIAGVPSATQATSGGDLEAAATTDPERSGVGAPDPAAVAALAGTLAHVSPLAEGSELLWVDISYANPPLPEARIVELLRPLAGNVAELSLARCDVTDGLSTLAAEMPNLRRLDLSGTAVTDATIHALSGHPSLRELVLAKTAVTDAAGDAIKAMPALERVYLWSSQCTPEVVAQLNADRPELVADAGQFAESAVLEVEPPPRLGGAPTTAASLMASNATCPVSGTAVDPKYQIVYEGRVIGFCCPDCPGKFWADPAKYAEKLKP